MEQVEGRMVGGYLKLVRPLGRGGMGAVWVAEHQRIGGEVAVKFLSTEFVGDAATRARFEQEARVAAQVRSPHVVQVMDFGVTEDEAPQPYIVMELLRGEDLSKHLERNGPLQLQTVETILAQVCQALGYAHSMGVVHRDIKPENVFLVSGPTPFAKLLDFGIALGNNPNVIQRMTQTGVIMGTAHYMSPEQLFTAKEVDHRADLWALGILTYQMITARLPFHGDTFGALCVNVQAGDFAPVSGLAPVPPALDGWFAKALATDKNQRFQSTDEMFQAFQVTLHDLDAEADTQFAPVLGVAFGAAQHASGPHVAQYDSGPQVPAEFDSATLATGSQDVRAAEWSGPLASGPQGTTPQGTAPQATAHAAPAGPYRTGSAVSVTAAEKVPKTRAWPWLLAGGALLALVASAAIAFIRPGGADAEATTGEAAAEAALSAAAAAAPQAAPTETATVVEPSSVFEATPEPSGAATAEAPARPTPIAEQTTPKPVANRPVIKPKPKAKSPTPKPVTPAPKPTVPKSKPKPKDRGF